MHDPKLTHIVDTEYRSLEYIYVYDGLESDGPFVIFQTHEILLIFVIFQSAVIPVPEILLYRALSVI